MKFHDEYDKYLEKVKGWKRLDRSLSFSKIEFLKRAEHPISKSTETIFKYPVLAEINNTFPYLRSHVVGDGFWIRVGKVTDYMCFKHRFITKEAITPYTIEKSFLSSSPSSFKRFVFIVVDSEGISLQMKNKIHIRLFDFWSWIWEDVE